MCRMKKANYADIDCKQCVCQEAFESKNIRYFFNSARIELYIKLFAILYADDTILMSGDERHWLNNDVWNIDTFCKMVTTRLQCLFVQNWNENVFNSSECLNYRLFKTTFSSEKYITKKPLKSAIIARGFQHLPRELANVNEWQNHVWSLLLHKFKENTPKIEKMIAHFILQPYHHFLTRTRFL